MDVERIRGFRRRLQRESAEEVVPTANGVGIVSPSIGDVYDHNYLSVEVPQAPAAVLAEEADAVLERGHHRRVIVEQSAPGLADEFLALGFVRSTHLVLAHGREPDRRVDTSAVEERPLDDILPARTEATLREPWGDASIAEQLNDAKRRIAAAVPTRFFAAIVDGEVGGWCELRVRGGVAQIEDVEVLAEHRGLGLGRAVVQRALDEGLRSADIVYLEALADDWPRELYGKLGFVGVDVRDYYTRLPAPITRVRLRTPRLELRVPTAAEVRKLYRVAAAGIHDPEFMPFGVAWTDDLDEDSFMAHHREEQAFVAFLDGEPIGVQSLRVELPEASTGSWLGRAYQGRGLGTEMRAAVLTYAFEHLGAQVARSGWLAGNGQSRRVSEKLGYEPAGSHEVSPRGEPVVHFDVELRRERFASPVPVEVTAP